MQHHIEGTWQAVRFQDTADLSCGRHTNATTVLLSHGVPIETVSRLLGHTDLKTTQIYARITNQKISSDMEILSHKLEKMEKEICDAI